MTLTAIRIIVRAVTIRQRKGEATEQILASYTKLSPYDKELVLSELRKVENPVVQSAEQGL